MRRHGRRRLQLCDTHRRARPNREERARHLPVRKQQGTKAIRPRSLLRGRPKSEGGLVMKAPNRLSARRKDRRFIRCARRQRTDPERVDSFFRPAKFRWKQARATKQIIRAVAPNADNPDIISGGSERSRYRQASLPVGLRNPRPTRSLMARSGPGRLTPRPALPQPRGAIFFPWPDGHSSRDKKNAPRRPPLRSGS